MTSSASARTSSCASRAFSSPTSSSGIDSFDVRSGPLSSCRRRPSPRSRRQHYEIKALPTHAFRLSLVFIRSSQSVVRAAQLLDVAGSHEFGVSPPAVALLVQTTMVDCSPCILWKIMSYYWRRRYFYVLYLFNLSLKTCFRKKNLDVLLEML
jgi:hypothetical protein